MYFSEKHLHKMVQRASEGGQYADQRPFNRSLRRTSINRPHRSLVSKTCRKIQQAPYFPTNENGKRCNGLVLPRRRKNKGKLSIKSFFQEYVLPSVRSHCKRNVCARGTRVQCFKEAVSHADSAANSARAKFSKISKLPPARVQCVRVRKNPRGRTLFFINHQEYCTNPVLK